MIWVHPLEWPTPPISDSHFLLSPLIVQNKMMFWIQCRHIENVRIRQIVLFFLYILFGILRNLNGVNICILWTDLHKCGIFIEFASNERPTFKVCNNYYRVQFQRCNEHERPSTWAYLTMKFNWFESAINSVSFVACRGQNWIRHQSFCFVFFKFFYNFILFFLQIIILYTIAWKT